MARRTVPTGRNVYDEAKARIHWLYDHFDTVTVSFSAGKDSMAALELTVEVAKERGRLPVDVYMWDEECLWTPTVEYIERTASREDVRFRWFCVPIRCRNASSRKNPYFFPWNPAERDLWVRELPNHPSVELNPYGFTPGDQHHEAARNLYPPSTHGMVATVLGRRCEESMTRRRLIMNSTSAPAFISKNVSGAHKNNITADPIYDWKVDDIWRACGRFGWDYNRIYNDFKRLGVPPAKQRTSAAFAEEAMGTDLSFFQLVDPDLWDKMQLRIDGAATADRYGATSLYRPSKVTKRPDQTWRERTYELIAQWDPTFQAHLQKTVAMIIKQQERKTRGVRELPDDPHDPATGLSWKLLAETALRGDWKGRYISTVVYSKVDRETTNAWMKADEEEAYE